MLLLNILPDNPFRSGSVEKISRTQKSTAADSVDPDNELCLPARPGLVCWQHSGNRPTLQLAQGTKFTIVADSLLENIALRKELSSEQLLGEIKSVLPEVKGCQAITSQQYQMALDFLKNSRTNNKPHRQMTALLQLATLIEKLNAQGVQPQLLEIGAGPSIEADRPKHFKPGVPNDLQLSPGPARVLGLLAKRGILKMDLHIVDPLLDPAIEERYGTIPHKLRISLRAIQAKPLSESLDFLSWSKDDPRFSLLTGHTDQVSLPSLNWELHADTYLDSDSSSQTAARFISQSAPYDLVFAQCTFGLPLEFLLLVKKGGRLLQFPYRRPGDAVILRSLSLNDASY